MFVDNISNETTFDRFIFVSDVQENLSSHIDMHTHAGNVSDNRVTLTFDLSSFDLRSMHAERLPCTQCLDVQTVFLLDTHTDKSHT